MIKECSKCGIEFTCFILRSTTEKDCSEQQGCWCEDFFLDIKTLEQLKRDFDNCLCPDCLKTFEKK